MSDAARVYRRSGWDKLRDIVITVMSSPTKNHYEQIWEQAKGDPDILVELIGGRYTSLVSAAANKIMENLNSDVARSRRMVSVVEVQADKVYRAKKEATRRDVDKVRSIADARSKSVNSRLFSTIQTAAETYAATKVEEYKKSVLFKFQINGRSIGEASASEIAAWQATQSGHLAFVGALIQGISPGDNRPIKDIISPSEADALWRSSHV